MATIQEIIDYSKANPNTDYAKQAYEHIQSGAFDAQAQKEGVDLSWAGRPKAPPVDNRNILQKGLGLFVDPLARLGTEAGQEIGKLGIQGVNAITGGALNKLTPEGDVNKALERATSQPTQVPGIGTQVKPLNQYTPENAVGDIGQTALIAAGPEVGQGASAIGRIGANAVLGAGMGASGAMSEGGGVGDVAKSGLLGGAVGGALSAATEGIGKLIEKLPQWFTQKALPKLNPENADFALKNMDLGSIKSNGIKAQKAVETYGKTIDSMLSHPQYAEETGAINSIVPQVVDALPNAKLDNNQIIDIVKSLAPKNVTLAEKLADGTANLAEQNTLRQELDKAVYPSIADKINPKLSFDKGIGKIVADALRGNVQTTAPETAPIFEEFAKEMNLNNALKFAQVKIQRGAPVSLYDIISGVGAGLPGVAAERAARTPAVLMGAAKGIQALGKTAPLMNAVGQAVKAPVIGGVTRVLGQ